MWSNKSLHPTLYRPRRTEIESERPFLVIRLLFWGRLSYTFDKNMKKRTKIALAITALIVALAIFAYTGSHGVIEIREIESHDTEPASDGRVFFIIVERKAQPTPGQP